jgi:hypothetical protein
MLSRLILLTLLFLPGSVHSEVHDNTFPDLFQHQFFTLTQGPELLCTTSHAGYFKKAQLLEIIDYYEKQHPALRQTAIDFLTRHSHPEHLSRLRKIKSECEEDQADSLCVLENYWESREAALRALAIFYDTKTLIKHSNDFDLPRFEPDHLRLFEKAIRKIPPFMRASMTKAKPMSQLEQAIETHHIKPATQALIREAAPDDADTRLWLDGTLPLTIMPGLGFRAQVVAQVYSGSNRVLITIHNFDKAKEKNAYRDIELTYLVDFRLPLMVHEFAHVIDNFHFWDGKTELYFFLWYKKLSSDIVNIYLIKDADLALWPSKWFEAFEYMWEVNNGRYNGKINEKLAELFAQYILIPFQLKTQSPSSYSWLKDEVFKGIEYQGYEACINPIVRELSFWEKAVAAPLGKQ